MSINKQAFYQSLKAGQRPSGMSPVQQALWDDGRGQWEQAHAHIDQLQDRTSAHVHAYLHRKEGDLWNADYWYKRAGKSRPEVSLDQEWEQLVEAYIPG